MKKSVFTEQLKSEIHIVEMPEYGSDEVLLKMVCIGVCGTDIQVFSGRNRYMKFPVTPFHEGVARVVAKGTNVQNLMIGDLVTIRPIINCGKCYACVNGHENACLNFNCLGVQSDGLGAEFVVINKHFVYPIPASTPYDEAVLIEPFAVGVHGSKRGNVQGKRVLVVGAGTIGNFHAQASTILGAKKVCVCDNSQDKIDYAKECGIETCINTSGKTLTQVSDEAFGSFPDVIIDCVGAPILFPQILDLAGKTTTIVLVGNYSAPLSVDIARIQRNELNVFGSITYTEEDFKLATKIICSGKVHTQGFITKKFHFPEVQKMMEYAVNNRANNMKIIMDFQE